MRFFDVSSRFRTLSILSSAVLVAGTVGVLATHSTAEAQLQNSDQRRCLTSMARAADKVAKGTRDQILDCLKRAGTGLLPIGMTADVCITTVGARLAGALDRTVETAADDCANPPDFAFTDSDTVNTATLEQERAMFNDLFGPDLAGALVGSATDRATAKCQSAVAKDYTKVVVELRRAVNTCVSDGLREGQINSAQSVQDCFAAIDDSERAAERIERGLDKIAKDFIKRCLVLDADAVFPGSCAGEPDFLVCMSTRMRCRTCVSMNDSAGLSEACDIFDDGEVNRSCIDPKADECSGDNGGNDCDLNGSCTDVQDDLDVPFECTCNAGYSGDGFSCDDENECQGEGSGHDCDVNASCSNTDGGFDCNCNGGWQGDGVTCTDEDECAGEGSGHDCDVNATCSNNPGSFSCSCNAGWNGTGVVCVDDDECADEGSGNNCDANAACSNTDGSFECACDDGWEGDGVTCTNIDECALETDDCDVNATCSDTDGSFDCDCNAGWHGSGEACSDDDECTGEGDGNNCSANATCTNTDGSFTCACNAGYNGDGVSCSDLNECAGQGGGHNCDGNATCTNTDGGFRCDCNAGWTGDGETCVDANECVEGNDNCDVNASCTNSPGGFFCACNPGWAGDGTSCSDVNECAEGSDNCSANATCTNNAGGFSCACNAGFNGNGLTCVDIDECALDIDGCDVNATCVNTAGSFDCNCNPGWQDFFGNGTCFDIPECDFGTDNCSTSAICIEQPGSFDCECKPGFYGNPFASACQAVEVHITSPVNGLFTTASSVTVTGTVTAAPLSDISLVVNNTPVTIAANGTWTTPVLLDSAPIFNGIRAEATQVSSGFTRVDRVVQIWGNSVPDGTASNRTVALGIRDAGFNSLEGILTDLVDLDPATLIAPGTVVISNFCVADTFLGCLGRVDAKIASTSLAGFGLGIDSMTNFVAGDIELTNLVVNVNITGFISCGLRVSASTTHIFGDYKLRPVSSDATSIDVNQQGNVNVVFSNFSSSFTSGICDFPLIGDLISLIVGDVQPMVRDGLVSALADPDGGGPQDAIVAESIESALGAIELTGPIGAGFGVDLDTPLWSVPEDTQGINLMSHAQMTPLCQDPADPSFPCPAGSPNYTAVLEVPSTPPVLGGDENNPPASPTGPLTSATTPGGIVYGMAIGIADTGFNQILAAQAESGALSSEISEFDILGTGTPIPLTTALLGGFFPEFSEVQPPAAIKMVISPTLAPILTGEAGPNGEIAELRIGHLLIDIVTLDNTQLFASLAVDMRSGFDLTIDPATGAIVPGLGVPAEEDVVMHLLDNPLGISEATVRTTLPPLVAPLLPELAGAFGAIPVPQFLGLSPTVVEVSRMGDYLGLYMNVTSGR